jgi:hypothetical protein
MQCSDEFTAPERKRLAAELNVVLATILSGIGMELLCRRWSPIGVPRLG